MKIVCRDCGNDVTAMNVKVRHRPLSEHSYPALVVEPCGHGNGVEFDLTEEEV